MKDLRSGTWARVHPSLRNVYHIRAAAWRGRRSPSTRPRVKLTALIFRLKSTSELRTSTGCARVWALVDTGQPRCSNGYREGPAWRFFDTFRSLLPARQLNAIVSSHDDGVTASNTDAR